MYLMRLGVEPKGIIGSGVSTREPFEAPHWDPARASAGVMANYTEISFDVLLDPDRVAPFDPRESLTAIIRDWNWTPQSSGIEIPANVAAALATEWGTLSSVITSNVGIGDTEIAALEGEQRLRMIRHRSRERTLRLAKIQAAKAANQGRLLCEVPRCGFDFAATYGERGRDFAEVHHVRPLAQAGPVLTTLADLAVVCANCHRMIHRFGDSLPLDDLIPFQK